MFSYQFNKAITRNKLCEVKSHAQLRIAVVTLLFLPEERASSVLHPAQSVECHLLQDPPMDSIIVKFRSFS